MKTYQKPLIWRPELQIMRSPLTKPRVLEKTARRPVSAINLIALHKPGDEFDSPFISPAINPKPRILVKTARRPVWAINLIALHKPGDQFDSPFISPAINPKSY